jgi:uncharacterized membrane protein
MISEQHARSKRPVSAALAGPYGHPFHPILVTVPIGAWVSSLVFDIASRFADEPDSLADGSTWLIGLGVLGALAAASIGFLDFMTLAPGSRAHRTALTHAALNLLVTAAYAAGLLWRQTGHVDERGVGIGQIVLSVVALAVLAVSGSLGGRLSYHYGVRVADEVSQADGFAPPTD